jgi:ribosomal protein L34E
MSTHRAGHDLRCERSKTDPRRCRCDCNGTLHGVERVRQQVLADKTQTEREP